LESGEKYMKKKKLLIVISTFITIIVLIGIPFGLNPSHGNYNKKSLTKNYGVSNVTTNINGNGTYSSEIDIDSIVPNAQELVENLENKGYEVNHFETVGELNLSVKRIYAKKNNSFIDICYDVSKADAESVFTQYEDSYPSFYILAQNDSYVYCISDKKTFKNAGFHSLANVGTQYIYE
jgi:hypothetical protein